MKIWCVRFNSWSWTHLIILCIIYYIKFYYNSLRYQLERLACSQAQEILVRRISLCVTQSYLLYIPWPPSTPSYPSVSASSSSCCCSSCSSSCTWWWRRWRTGSGPHPPRWSWWCTPGAGPAPSPRTSGSPQRTSGFYRLSPVVVNRNKEIFSLKLHIKKT